ncbi:hypothetical protein XELAEV_18041624mg [Xenopus laevis]|uniref:Uncharacterized protein n=1 Tax=Xenopus laevis TaxID=8355 RepID=A0A974C2C8_XENLA|nr:hypothetical protein XELAEV_18041624mg [Xenopus laevis]
MSLPEGVPLHERTLPACARAGRVAELQAIRPKFPLPQQCHSSLPWAAILSVLPLCQPLYQRRHEAATAPVSTPAPSTVKVYLKDKFNASDIAATIPDSSAAAFSFTPTSKPNATAPAKSQPTVQPSKLIAV